jgi:glucuronosyltransferase
MLVFNLFVMCNGKRILFLSPVSTKSHKIGFMPIAEGLAERGHRVTVVSPVEPLKQIQNLREIVIANHYYSSQNFDWFEMGSHDPDLTSISGIIKQFRALNIEGYQLFRANQDVQQIIRTKDVDLVVIDATINDFCFPFIEHLKVPFISYIPSTGIPWTIDAMGVPHESAYVPGGANDHGSEMTFIERAFNSLGMELFLMLRRYFVLEMVDDLVREDFPNLRPIAEIERDAELLIMNSHPTTAWSRPLPPYAIPIGPLHVRPAQPLPKVNY